MNFQKAKLKKKVRRPSWPEGQYLKYDDELDNWIRFDPKDKKLEPEELTAGDQLANDWESL